MLEALEAIRQAKTISIDFDGVLMKKFLGRVWINKPPSPNTWKSYLFNIWESTIHRFRPQMPGAGVALQNLKSQGKHIVLITGRNPYSAKNAIKWVKQKKLSGYFDSIHYPEHGVDATTFKIKAIGELGVDIHVDDDPYTVLKLSQTYPDKQFVLFKSSLEQYPSNVVRMSDWKDVLM